MEHTKSFSKTKRQEASSAASSERKRCISKKIEEKKNEKKHIRNTHESQNDSVDKINVKWKTKLDIYNISSVRLRSFLLFRSNTSSWIECLYTFCCSGNNIPQYKWEYNFHHHEFLQLLKLYTSHTLIFRVAGKLSTISKCNVRNIVASSCKRRTDILYTRMRVYAARKQQYFVAFLLLQCHL